MARIIVALLAVGLFLVSSPASAYVWRCHTPNGYVWTEQPPQNGDCEEYDGTFNRRAAPPDRRERILDGRLRAVVGKARGVIAAPQHVELTASCPQ